MRFVLWCGGLILASLAVSAQEGGKSYWFLLRADGKTWCGYEDKAQFMDQVNERTPLESARATYTSGNLAEFTFQIGAESGDWIVIDKYTPGANRVTVRRANLLAGPQLEIIQETTIQGGKVEPFHTVSITTLDGKKVDPQEEAARVDYPAVPI